MNVTDTIKQYQKINGNSYLATWDQWEGRYPSIYAEMEQWCDDMLGEENWFRMFNKFWFTDEQCLTMFKLAWSGGPHVSRPD